MLQFIEIQDALGLPRKPEYLLPMVTSFMILKPADIDMSEFLSSTKTRALRRLYGLPEKVSFCSRCVFSNQKPNSEREYKHTLKTHKPTLDFDENGVCSACLIAEEKKNVDWVKREQELRKICDFYRKSDGSYDCLIPGSGGKDSFYAAHKLKYVYGMNPLTVTWAPHIYTDWGWRNFQSWMHAGFDNYLFTPNGRIHRLLTRLALENLLHPFQPFIMGQMYFPPKMAIKHNIPLVFYGENPAEYGNRKAENKSAKKETNYFSTEADTEVFISGMSTKTLTNDFGVTPADLSPYLPASADELVKNDIDVQYLGYYLPWHPQECYYYAVENSDFTAAPERTAGTYSKYSSIDDKIDDLHYFTTFIKFGIGRASYDASQEVRNGDITRDEALALVKKFDGEYSKRFEKEVFEYLSIPEKEFSSVSGLFEEPVMSRDYFDRLVNNFRSPHIWKFEDNTWQLRNKSF